MTRFLTAALLFVILVSAGCSPGLYIEGKRAAAEGDFETALTKLYEAISKSPDNYKAWNEIGIVYYKQEQPDKALEAFAASNRIKPNALSSFYHGLIFEEKEDFEKAIQAYAAAARLQGPGRTRDMIEGRLDVLVDRKLALDASEAVRNEKDIDTSSLPENTVAVINFDGSSLPEGLEPLALGIAEFTSMDLAKVSKLRVVERVKINAILDELALSRSKYADSGSAPRLGKLLGSRRVVLGTITGTGEESFRIDGALVNTSSEKVDRTEPRQGNSESFFDMQKAFVFNLLDTMGVKLTKDERDAIREVPTESFLAVMAYSEGLSYQKRGMYDEAASSFRNAGKHDPGFAEATVMAGRMEQTASYNGTGGGHAGASAFGSKIVSSMNTETLEVGLAGVQATSLMNSGFIINPDSYWNFGTVPVAPPGGGLLMSGYGVIIIEGNLDAD